MLSDDQPDALAGRRQPDAHSAFTRRVLLTRTAAALSVAAGLAANSSILAPAVRAQSQDPFTYIRPMEPTTDLGQAAGEAANAIAPVEIDGAAWDAYIQVPIKEKQDFHYTCEFDSSDLVLQANGYNLTLAEQIEFVGIDTSIEPYYEEMSDGVFIWGGDIAEHFSGDYTTNFLARARGSAMRKVFAGVGLTVTPVQSRAGVEEALFAGKLVWFKSTVDFLKWVPATWIAPDQHTYPVVLGNDHALIVMGYNADDVIIRDPLGPTSTNERRPYQYRVAWDRFLAVFAAQGNDGLAVGPKARS